MKAKNILFRLKLKGNGIVNFDSSDQKFMYNGTNLNNMKTIHNNTSYSKKRFYKNGEDLTYKIVISSDCLRHDIFKNDVSFQSPNLINNEHVLYSFIASPAAILRGYLFAEKEETLKRKGPLTIIDAEQTCSAVSYIETFSRSGLKISDSEAEKADNSFFKKEVVGNINYATLGCIDLMQLQFISCDQIFDRYSFNPDLFKIYAQFLKTKLPSFNSELGYYQINGSDIEIPEFGVKLDNNSINILVKGMLERILTLNIVRKNSFAKTSELEYKIVYDVIEDTYDSEDGWVSVANKADLDAIKFDVEDFYVSEDKEKAEVKRGAIVANYEERKASGKAKKLAEKSKSKSKSKKDVDESDELNSEEND